MSRKYKFAEREGAYFVSFATVNWIDVFTPLPRESFCVVNVIKYESDACNSQEMAKNVQHSHFSFARIIIFNGK
jgi:hypothetical protein